MTYTRITCAFAAALIATAATAALADTASKSIDLTYVWTAHEGQEERLIGTYQAVGEMLKANAPGLLSYDNHHL